MNTSGAGSQALPTASAKGWPWARKSSATGGVTYSATSNVGLPPAAANWRACISAAPMVARAKWRIGTTV
ncbi:MAG: hypothetical protein ACTS6O_14535 [Giesbergeria sp.]